MISPISNIFNEILQYLLEHELTKAKHASKEKEILFHKFLEFYIDNSDAELSLIPEEILNFSFERYLSEGNNLKLIIKYNLIKFEFFEIRPPHSRQILITQIQDLLESFDLLGKIKLSEISSDSLFSILYSPFKSTKGLMMNSSFLVYQRLNFEANNFTLNSAKNFNVNKNFVEVPIIGILPIKFENKMFLSMNSKNLSNMNLRNMNSLNPAYTQSNLTSNMNSNNNNNFLLVKNLIVNISFNQLLGKCE
jgi:hypothetical protein